MLNLLRIVLIQNKPKNTILFKNSKCLKPHHPATEKYALKGAVHDASLVKVSINSKFAP